MSNGTPDPGWYTDPLEPTGERYWSGAEWTHETRTAAMDAPPAAVDAPTAAVAEPEAIGATPASSLKARIPLLAALVGVVVLLAGGAFIVLSGGGGGSAELRLFIHDRPDRDGAVHAVAPGDDLDRDNEVIGEASWVYAMQVRRGGSGTPASGDDLILEYSEDGDGDSEVGIIVDGEFVEILRLRDENADVSVNADGSSYVVMTSSYDGDNSRCMIGSDLTDLDTISRSGSCYASEDGSVIVSAEWDEGEFRYEAMGRDGREIVSGTSADYPILSSNGDLLATVRGGSSEELEVWDLGSGEQLEADTRADDIRIGGIVGNQVVVIAYDFDRDRAEVFLVRGDGTETEVETPRSFNGYPQLLEEAGVLALVDEDESVYYSMSTGEEIGSISGSWVQNVSSRIDGRWMAFGIDDNRVTVYWANGATQPVEIASHRMEGGQPAWAWFGSGQSGAYTLDSWVDDDSVLVRVSGASEATIIEDGYRISPRWISSDGSQILGTTYDNGTELILFIDGQRPEVLDDEDNIYDVNVRDGVAYYTARDGDDREVRSVALSADAHPETLYDDADLVAVLGAEHNGVEYWLSGEGE